MLANEIEGATSGERLGDLERLGDHLTSRHGVALLAGRCLGSFCHAEQDIQSAPDPERATLHEAVLECAAQGGRLCSADELLGLSLIHI